jgi:hypothetical protein
LEPAWRRRPAPEPLSTFRGAHRPAAASRSLSAQADHADGEAAVGEVGIAASIPAAALPVERLHPVIAIQGARSNRIGDELVALAVDVRRDPVRDAPVVRLISTRSSNVAAPSAPQRQPQAI